ncbi:hypothetical protein P691DRAFT_609079, partial [Macrolepiota fuliginosa MF-IS2]
LTLTANNKSLLIPAVLKNPNSSKVTTLHPLLDSGAQGNFVSPLAIEWLGLQMNNLHHPIVVRNVDSTLNKGKTIAAKTEVTLNIDQKDVNISCYVTEIGEWTMILSLPFLKDHNPDINWSQSTSQW